MGVGLLLLASQPPPLLSSRGHYMWYSIDSHPGPTQPPSNFKDHVKLPDEDILLPTRMCRGKVIGLPVSVVVVVIVTMKIPRSRHLGN